jgi:hypothetical protein
MYRKARQRVKTAGIKDAAFAAFIVKKMKIIWRSMQEDRKNIHLSRELKIPKSSTESLNQNYARLRSYCLCSLIFSA